MNYDVIIAGPVVTWGLLGLLVVGVLIATILLLIRKRISRKILSVGLVISAVIVVLGLLGLLLS